jgi:hypothetical protein
MTSPSGSEPETNDEPESESGSDHQAGAAADSEPAEGER